MRLLSKFGIPFLASLGLFGGGASFYGVTLWKRDKSFESDDWQEHVEQHHSELVEVAPGLFQVCASYFTFPKYRNMTVLKLPGGNLLLHSPIALPDTEMAKLEELGKPAFLYVPNESRSARVDVQVYKKRYPESKIICPEFLVDSMKAHVPIDAAAESELRIAEPGMLFINPPLKQFKESIIDAPLENGQRALLFGELLWNIKFFPGLFGKLFVLAKLAGDGLQPQVSSSCHTFGFPNEATRTHFWSEFSTYADGVLPGTENDLEPIPRYAALTVQHGNPVTLEVHRKLAKVAKTEAQSL